MTDGDGAAAVQDAAAKLTSGDLADGDGPVSAFRRMACGGDRARAERSECDGARHGRRRRPARRAHGAAEGLRRSGLRLLHQPRKPQGRAACWRSRRRRSCFHWKSLRRQVRMRGAVEPVAAAEADAYFASASAPEPHRRLGEPAVASRSKAASRWRRRSRATPRGTRPAPCRGRRIGRASALSRRRSSSGATAPFACTTACVSPAMERAAGRGRGSFRDRRCGGTRARGPFSECHGRSVRDDGPFAEAAADGGAAARRRGITDERVLAAMAGAARGFRRARPRRIRL